MSECVGGSCIRDGYSAHDVLKLLYSGARCQKDIVKHFCITKAACSIHFKRLSEEGFIESYEERSNRKGRPSLQWRLKSEGNYFCGVLLNDGIFSVTLVDMNGECHWGQEWKMSGGESRDELLVHLFELYGSGISYAASRGGRILQSFIAMSGVIRSDGTIHNLLTVPQFNGMILDQFLEERFGIPCYMDTLHYSYVHGVSHRFAENSTALLVEWGSGLGGILTNGKEIFNWSEFPSRRNRGLWNMGHIPVVSDGRLCQCGRRGCLEAYVCSGAMLQELGRDVLPGSNAVVSLLESGDEAAYSLLKRNARMIGENWYWPIELFGVDTVIITGPFAPFLEHFRDDFLAGLALHGDDESVRLLQIVGQQDTALRLGVGTALEARQFFFFPDMPRRCRGIYCPKE